MSTERLRYVNASNGETVEAATAAPLPSGWNSSSDLNEQALALLKEPAIAEIADLLKTMAPNQVLAVHSFAACLRVGAVQPAFFTLVADALLAPGASR